MTESSQQTPAPSASASASGIIFLTVAEFYWLTLGMWVGGIFILTLMPYLLIPRVGMGLGVAGSYLLFFLCWQPIQVVTQRTFGMRAGLVRMLMFVAAAATLAFYLRENLLALTR
ncbi:MAG: hypothetical protein H0T71_01710 [Acidobacteria bacterium]|nr:hypothetical protein [Acidobacteriota bacterium]